MSHPNSPTSVCRRQQSWIKLIFPSFLIPSLHKYCFCPLQWLTPQWCDEREIHFFTPSLAHHCDRKLQSLSPLKDFPVESNQIKWAGKHRRSRHPITTKLFPSSHSFRLSVQTNTAQTLNIWQQIRGGWQIKCYPFVHILLAANMIWMSNRWQTPTAISFGFHLVLYFWCVKHVYALLEMRTRLWLVAHSSGHRQGNLSYIQPFNQA